jgi:hypothetical protein
MKYQKCKRPLRVICGLAPFYHQRADLGRKRPSVTFQSGQSTGWSTGGNDVDGMVSAPYVADCILDGIREQRFLILPHPQVTEYV